MTAVQTTLMMSACYHYIKRCRSNRTLTMMIARIIAQVTLVIHDFGVMWIFALCQHGEAMNCQRKMCDIYFVTRHTQWCMYIRFILFC